MRHKRFTPVCILVVLCVLLAACAAPPSMDGGAQAASGSAQGAQSGSGEAAAGDAQAQDSIYTPDFEPAAAAVCVVNENTGTVVYEKKCRPADDTG